MSHKYFIGFCNLDLHIENCQSLKEKRRVVASLKEKLNNRYNIAICEFGDLSLWQRTELGIVTCSNDQKIIDSTMKAVTNYIEQFHSVTLVNVETKIILSTPYSYSLLATY